MVEVFVEFPGANNVLCEMELVVVGTHPSPPFSFLLDVFHGDGSVTVVFQIWF